MDINKKMKILVVDDFATMRKVIRNLLKQVGDQNIVERKRRSGANSAYFPEDRFHNLRLEHASH